MYEPMSGWEHTPDLEMNFDDLPHGASWQSGSNQILRSCLFVPISRHLREPAIHT
jgi:hypothetical protein